MTVAILDPFSGIAGDMLLGALVDVGLEEEWLRALPARLGLPDVTVRIERVRRGDIACCKVDFDIPPQPHGRHLREIRDLVNRAGLPDTVRDRAMAAFEAITAAEGDIHGVPPERVHLHEVGAVDAILDVVGGIWGLERLGVRAVYCGTLALGDGYVQAAHGLLPVPAPATLKLLEGLPVRPGPEGAGELVTPTGAALVRVLSRGTPPPYVPRRSGFGAGTKDPTGRANALRVILADLVEQERADGERVEELVVLAADMDDMSGERAAECLAALRADARVRDAVSFPVQMKKGRAGLRIEVLCAPADATGVEDLFFRTSSTIGIRRATVRRRALSRELRRVDVAGQPVTIKLIRLPDGSRRGKPEADDVVRAASVLGITPEEVYVRALAMAGVGRWTEDAASELRPTDPTD